MWKTLTGAPLWRTGDKGAPLSPQKLAVRKQLQRKPEAPTSAPTTQTQLSTGEVINVSKQDDQGNKCTLTACRIEDIEETPPARFRDLRYLLWVVNADLFVEYDSAGFVPKWLFDMMMLGKDLISYGDADVVHRIGRDMQRLWRFKNDKDPTTAPFHHARLPVYSWLSGSVTSNMYQFDEHGMWIGTTSRWDKQVYLLFSPFWMPFCAQGLAHCCFRYSSLFIAFRVNYVTYSAGHFEEMQNKNLGGFMPLIHVLWYLDKYLLDCGHADAVVVEDDAPAMAANLAMSEESGRTKVLGGSSCMVKNEGKGRNMTGFQRHQKTVVLMDILKPSQTSMAE